MSTSLLPAIQTQFNLYGFIIIIIFGFIGNSLIIILFSRHNAKSCSIYLICASITSNLMLLFVIPIDLYSMNYGNLNLRSIVFCKLRYYISHSLAQTSRYYTVLACIDRFALTKLKSNYQVLTKVSTAKYFMYAVVMIWHVIPIHIIIFTTISDGRCGQFGLYYILYYIYSIVFAGAIPLILMSVFGYLTYNNMAKLHGRIQSIDNSHRKRNIRKRDRELLVMVLGEIIVSFLTLFPYPFVLLEMAITSYIGMDKSIDQIRIENFITILASFLYLLNVASPFYIFVAISKTFRNDFKTFIKNICSRKFIYVKKTLNQTANVTEIKLYQ